MDELDFNSIFVGLKSDVMYASFVVHKTIN